MFWLFYCAAQSKLNITVYLGTINFDCYTRCSLFNNYYYELQSNDYHFEMLAIKTQFSQMWSISCGINATFHNIHQTRLKTIKTIFKSIKKQKQTKAEKKKNNSTNEGTCHWETYYKCFLKCMYLEKKMLLKFKM